MADWLGFFHPAGGGLKGGAWGGLCLLGRILGGGLRGLLGLCAELHASAPKEQAEDILLDPEVQPSHRTYLPE